MSSRAWFCWRFGDLRERGRGGACPRERIGILSRHSGLQFVLLLASLLPLGKSKDFPSCCSPLCVKAGITPSSGAVYMVQGVDRAKHLAEGWAVVAADPLPSLFLPPPSFLLSSLCTTYREALELLASGGGRGAPTQSLTSEAY